MIILPESGGMAMTNCFVIADESSKEAVLFDAPDHTVSPPLGEVHPPGWDPPRPWLTHRPLHHPPDHKVVTDRFPEAKVLIHRLDEPLLANPGPMSKLFMLPFTIPPGKADSYLDEGQTLRIGSLEAHVLHTPGHAPGHVAFHFPKEKVLVGGDLIIGGAGGRTPPPGGRPAPFRRAPPPAHWFRRG